MSVWQFLEDELDIRCAGTAAREVAKNAGELPELLPDSFGHLIADIF